MDEKKNNQIFIKSTSSISIIDLRELWNYRDLIFLFVKRDITTIYKQTVLGPLWFILQPLLTTIVFTVVFGNIINIPIDNTPKMLFYLSGITVWNYFAACLNKTSNTFILNAGIFGKVYFPRLVIPISIVLSSLISFAIQLLFFLCFLFSYIAAGADVYISRYVLLFPLLIINMAALGLGAGIIISSLTTKYRDLGFMVSFGVQLLMYLSPVIFPISTTTSERLLFLMNLNPMTPVIETFRLAFLGTGSFNGFQLIYSSACSASILAIGLLLFSKTEKNFMDTV